MSNKHLLCVVVMLLCTNELFMMQKVEKTVEQHIEERISPVIANNVLNWSDIASSHFDLIFSTQNSVRLLEYCSYKKIKIQGINKYSKHLIEGIIDRQSSQSLLLNKLFSITDFDPNSMESIGGKNNWYLSNFHQTLVIMSTKKLKQQFTEIIDYFLQRKADLNVKNFYKSKDSIVRNNTPFHYLASILKESKEEQFRDIKLKDRPILITRDYEGFMKLLFRFKANPNSQDQTKSTPFHYAMAETVLLDNNNKNINVWLENKANPNLISKTCNMAPVELALKHNFYMNTTLDVFLSKKKILTLESFNSVITELERRASNPVTNEEECNKIGDFSFLEEKGLQYKYAYINTIYNTINLKNIELLKKNITNNNIAPAISSVFYHYVEEEDFLLTLCQEDHSLLQRNDLLKRINRLFIPIKKKDVESNIFKAINDGDVDRLNKILVTDEIFIDESSHSEGIINHTVGWYKWYKSHNMRNDLQKYANILRLLVQHDIKPYLFSEDNEFPYEAILAFDPSKDQIEMSNMLLDRIGSYYLLHFTGVRAWLKCMKCLQQKMPTPLKKTIATMANFIPLKAVQELQSTIKEAKNEKWYTSGLQRNNLRMYIIKLFNKYGVKNPEKEVYWEVK